MTKQELLAKEEKLYKLIRREYGTTKEGNELVDLVWELVDLAKETMCEEQE